MPGLKPGPVDSHPGRPLEDHLLQTANLAEQIALQYLGQVPENLQAVCLLHDVAKAHAKFQKRLKGKGRFPHAGPSAYIALSVTGDIVTAEVIRCHHTHLASNFINEIWCNSNYQEIRQVVGEIPVWQGSEAVTARLNINPGKWQELLPSSEGWDDLLYEIEDNTVLDVNLWLKIKILYSLLVTADRLDALSGRGINLEMPGFTDPGNVIEGILAGLKPTPLTKWRNQVRNEVLKKAEKTISGPGVYTLTLPTGAGKTLLALDLALRIARQESKGGIIYVLPFITIVEQNSAVAKTIFPSVQEDHHLAYDDSSPEEHTSQLQRFVSLFRYWKEPVVVSTFAKLWEVLYSPRGNAAMSFHRLANAVVLLDEPQSIPARFWKGFGNTLEFITAKLNTTFILITATQPKMVRGRELAPESISVPKCRYTAGYFKEPVGIEQMLVTLNRYEMSRLNTMVVANTRRAALEILFMIKRSNVDDDSLFFLSSWVTPADRKRMMSEIKTREERELPRYLVATQVVEAGVDLSFDLVARDIAPLDSIVQVAGRCNRHMSERQGQILIFELINEEGRKYASSVYDAVLVNITREVLGKGLEKNGGPIAFSELEVQDMLKEYYTRIADALQDDGPWFDIQKGNWDCQATLFEEPVYESTVFIDRSGEIKATLEELNETGNKLEDRDKRKQLWKKIQEHAISVPEKELDQWYEACGASIWDENEKDIDKISAGLWIVNPRGVGRIYQPDIGFIPWEIYQKYYD
ncbi:CRISPR-associated helicase Cas3' [Desulfallas thermosapovorans]|uniref:CRISPR-associated endonuclease/helicase Cas3 n=1 Tax=Desulfallas thermosapovorans DSM 6562 TaxID=1121431 RepID=A0A5S4ZNJ8_9FIRM|nr:CRISPR-associated helicase Cas3' [Desulfallas thermosapovorans]TYO92777.1 CRISPR-associated endonuclease/helicase Cas3 [Desulfallas thermosapovorans DSM 6562]